MTGRPVWRDALAPYAVPHRGRALLDLATSVVPYIGLFALSYLALDVSVWLTLALAVPTAGFLLRTYILFHDCAHGSFLPGRRTNRVVGTALALLVYTPFQAWRHSHAVHHATAGDLDRRGVGDVPTYTVAEYRAMSFWQRLGYRLFRNPVVMFGIGPLYALMIQPRIPSRGARARLNRSIMLTNIALVAAVGAACWLLGWKEFLLIQGPAALLAGAAGVFLFYVQHQFEDTYWQSGEAWTYEDAALKGSSYLRLPQPWQFFTGNIGFHHVHHLSARIPNYNLQRAHENNPVCHSVPTLSFWDGVRSVRLKLWDEKRGRLVGWRDARRAQAPA